MKVNYCEGNTFQILMALHTFDCLQLDLSFLYLLLKFLQLDHLLYSADYAVVKLDNILRMRSVIVRD